MRIQKFNVIGISVRTTNVNGQSGKDIPALWNTFMSEAIQSKIPGKISEELFCIYTDYEKDHTKPYTTILGCKVENLDVVPENMIGKTIESANYEELIAKGNLSEGIVFNKWLEIWNSDLDRSFTADFEVYGEKTQNPENAEVAIYIALQ
ncbi:GyrI-like domain-containing protein [Flavobacterium aquidurense]|uniref:GyrI-like domain-containing protein n=1 Tax=Flavobacterium aquidurense TaxID=362413 RepID=UPI00091C6FCB|nr:effector binding domain-containing protein [Flavobacterium aquidurense]OXA72374.1 AraC family transcriptional regulator [Flavobacterium aquidurense]SHG42881.1 Predicted transcriptional regulator YdeE, contains AraC-type DNA-binding domain [Flavobacterium frigidimaris]